MTEFLADVVARARDASRVACVVVLCLCAAAGQAQTATAPSSGGRAAAVAGNADFIVVVVNQELVTNAELQGRLVRIREEAARNKTALPPAADLRKQVLDALIDERVQITNARETGPKIDEAELDRAVMNNGCR